MGPFHVAKVFVHENQWWMTSSYKAEHRQQSRLAGAATFRGETPDEAGLWAGLYLTRIQWDHDRPVLCKPALDEIP